MFLRLGLWNGPTDRGVRVTHGPERRGLDGGEFRIVPVVRSSLGAILPRLLGAVERCRVEHGERVGHLRPGWLLVDALGLLVTP